MGHKVILLYESDRGSVLCDMASAVLSQAAVSFELAFKLPVRRCARGQEIGDDILDLCADADAVLVMDSNMACLPALADELLCACRLRELRYTDMIANRSLAGAERPLNAVLIQALSGQPDALQSAAVLAYSVSGRDNLPISQVPPTGRLASEWKKAAEEADSLSAPFHARELQLAQAVPDMVYRPSRIGVILCPPYAGNILADAAAALCGAPGMCYDIYTGGQCRMYAPLNSSEDCVDPFGMLRCLRVLLQDLGLEREAGCLEAAIRNVLQQGWRTEDIPGEGCRQTDAEHVIQLVCSQIAVAGEWIGRQ